MSWGLWKKFKKGIKKAGMWLKDKLGKAAKFAGKIKPELAKIENDQGWGKKLAKISDDIIFVNFDAGFKHISPFTLLPSASRVPTLVIRYPSIVNILFNFCVVILVISSLCLT